jgi:hypothetical protein
MIKTRVLAICCEDGNDLDRLRGDPLLKLPSAASRKAGMRSARNRP